MSLHPMIRRLAKIAAGAIFAGWSGVAIATSEAAVDVLWGWLPSRDKSEFDEMVRATTDGLSEHERMGGPYAGSGLCRCPERSSCRTTPCRACTSGLTRHARRP